MPQLNFPEEKGKTKTPAVRTFPPCAGANRGCWKPDIMQGFLLPELFTSETEGGPSEGGHHWMRKGRALGLSDGQNM